MSHCRQPFCLALALLFLLPAAPAAAQQRRFGDTTTVVVVEVPVYVTKDGEPVRGLTAANFEITDGRKTQPITGFEVIDLAQKLTPQQATQLPVAGRRHFLLLFDLAFSDPEGTFRAREAAKKVVAEQLQPSDLAAVALYTTSRGPSVVLGFTSDRRQIETAIDTLGVPQLVGRGADPLGLMVNASPSEGAMQASEAGGGGAAASRQEAVTEFLRAASEAEGKVNRDTLKNQVTAFSRAFADLAKLMGTVQGTKHVVYFSEGFDSSVLQGEGATMETAAAIERGEVQDIDSDEMFGSTRQQNDISQMLEELRRANCIVQAVDIARLKSGVEERPRVSGQDSLLQMAKGTGGELYANFTDLSQAMSKVLQRTSVTYVLSFQPDNLKQDGSFRKLRVRLKDAPGGARISHRPGYYSPKPTVQVSALERRLQTAAEILGGEPGGPIGASVLATSFRASGPNAYVPVIVEVNGPALIAGQPDKTLVTEIYAYAMDGDGSIQGYFTQTLGVDLNKVEAQLKQSGLKFFGDLELPPGEYSVRVLVRNAKTGAHALQVVPVVVPAYDQAGPVVLPPLFPEPQGKWLLTRETQVAGAPQPEYPFIIGQEPFIPASKPVLAANQGARVTVMAYNLGNGDVRAEAGVLRADGQPVQGGALQLTERQRGGGRAPDRLVGTFTPSGLAPGEYLLRVTVTDGASGAAQTSTIPFVVG
ncbi:MAG TPA: VWA domain-containing protein [Thermoanaerobaculia bacterium]|nr:VWA domain-containing protein [Thermoanaerobaculia bacterium]